MITLLSGIYTKMLEHYKEKWRQDKVDRNYERWEEAQKMKADYGYSEQNFEKIPKRKGKNRGLRKKHASYKK